jgi:sugar phosphate isomerase/epimerase
MAYPPLGAQLIVFGKQMDLDQETARVLDAVQAAGFGAIECGVGLHSQDRDELKEMLAQRGLRIAGLHGGLDMDLDETLRVMEQLDTRDLCISGLGGWNGTEAARYHADIERLNAMGRRCREHGVHVHYHNHAYEFARTDAEETGMDLIMSEMDRDVTSLCVDVAWVHIAGQDPAIFMRKNADIVGYVHLKDYTGDRHWVALGNGAVPLDSVMKALDKLPHARWACYEQDTSDRPAEEACAISHKYLADTYGYR